MRLIPKLTGLQWVGAVLMIGAIVGTGILIGTALPRSHAVPSVPLSELGLDIDHAAKAQVIASTMPKFQIVGAAAGEDNSRKNVRLWDAMLQVRGEHLPNTPQQIGDCVSWGAANAVNYLQAVQLVRGPPGEFHAAYAPYIYGVSRVDIGRAHGSHFRGDGSVGAYAAEGLQKEGCLRADHERVPPYDGATAREWGAKGPPQWARDIARPNVVQTVAPVGSAEEARDAICNGFPVTVASGWWGTTDIPVVDGRRVARRTTAWAHQQCLIAYDGSGREPLFYCLNSWGPNAHPAPLQGEPPGGYWIRFRDVDRICREGDSWAFSGFVGFPAAGPNWDDLLRRSVMVPPVGQVPGSLGKESIMSESWIGLGLCVAVAVVGLLLFRMARLRVALVLAVCVLGSSVSAQDFEAAASRPSAQGMDWNRAGMRPATAVTGEPTGDMWQVACQRVTVGQVGKPQALVFIRAKGCSACDQLYGHLKRNAETKGWQVGKSEDADFRVVDVLDNRNLARLYGVEVVPTTLYLSRTGAVVERREGFDAEVSWVAGLVAQY